MSQSDSFMTIGASFPELKRAAKEIAERRGVSEEAQQIINRIIREIDKAQIIEESLANYKKTGKKLPVELKTDLSTRYCYSIKKVEELVYSNIKGESE